MKTNNTSRYVAKARREKEIPHHPDKSIERLTYISSDLIPQANIFVGIETTTGDRVSDVEFHTHDVDEFYCLLGGVTEEIQVEDEKFTATAPASVYFPAGKRHRSIRVHGDGKIIVILLKPKYDTKD